MSRVHLPGEPLSPSQKALFVIEELKSKLRAAEEAKREPIAVIGMGCRFPGKADTPDDFWRILRDGVDAVTEVPPQRWDVDKYFDPDSSAVGKMYCRHGAFIHDIDRFDADFFGISPREAIRMDPQQRLLLEVTWDALERAGQAPDRLKHSYTGVFIGMCTDDYALANFAGSPESIDAYLGLGTARNMAAGRLAYVLGVHGPTLQIDTACSSSLLAVHMACRSLRSGECDMAIAGGVNLMISPGPTIFFCKVGALARDGRCRTFDAGANGYVRGEGCGAVILQRLSDALAVSAPIMAVIKGSAVNHDGPSGGLTVPNGRAQADLISRALKSAGVTPSQVDYIEAHGTGTPLGDSIEVTALAQVFGKDRPKDRPLVVGSVKPNIGHLEAVAGLSGFMKTILCLQNGEIPPQLHFTKPNPSIQWDALPITIPKELMPWPENQNGRTAGVSSFGFSGTNVHIVLAEAPPIDASDKSATRPLSILTLSGKTEAALSELASLHSEHLGSNPNLRAESVCHTLNTGRSHFDHRLSIVAQTAEELREKLAQFSSGKIADAVCAAKPRYGEAPKIAFLFSDANHSIGSWGRQLYETQIAFREAVDRCDDILETSMRQSALSTRYSAREGAAVGTNAVTRLFALEYAFFETWRSWGIEPTAVAGCGFGKLAAACAAGVFSLEDSLSLVLERSRLLEVFSSPGEGPLTGTPGDHLAAFGRGLTALTPSLRFVTGCDSGAGQWLNDLENPRGLEASVQALYSTGCRIFLEIGPNPGIVEWGKECIKDPACLWRPSLGQGEDDWRQMLETLGELYVRGASVDWVGFDSQCSQPKVALPTYPFQRRRYWMEKGVSSVPAREKMSDETALPLSVIPSDSADCAHGRPGAGQLNKDGSHKLVDYYRTLAADVDRAGWEAETEEDRFFIRFAPFPDTVPGFSWFLALADPKGHPEHASMVRHARSEMELVQYRSLDFSAIQSVLDIGCGYSRDLIALAEKYPHLRLHGCNISPDQIAIGQKRIKSRGLQERVSLYELDSSGTAFPGRYDLAIGFQVIHHIKDKYGVFENLGRHINNGGFLVLAEIISDMAEEIEHEESSAYFSTKEQWAKLLARHRFRIVECVDASREMGNFLEDPNFESNLEAHISWMAEGKSVEADIYELTRSHLEGPHLLGSLLRKHLAFYGLLTIQKDSYISETTLIGINREKLSAPMPYRRVVSQSLVPDAQLLYQSGVQKPWERPVDTSSAKPVLADLLASTHSERYSRLEAYLNDQVALVLETSVELLDPSRSLIHLGIDSIMALELKKTLESELAVNLPLETLVEGPSISRLTQLLLPQLMNRDSCSSELHAGSLMSGLGQDKRSWVGGKI